MKKIFSKKHVLVLALNLWCFSFSFSQENKIQKKAALTGHISDETGFSLPGVSVVINALKIGEFSDFSGNFSLLGLAPGKYSVDFSYMGYETISKEIEIIAGKTNFINIQLFPAKNKLQEVVVNSFARQGRSRALNKQKNNSNITNLVSADQMGKFPDDNIGDALKRIPGIAMQNDQGEARDIIIRGLSPQLNAVTLNGDRIPSAEGDNRRVQMDLIPTDMISMVQVNKTVTPDMEGDAIGGSVNLVTRDALQKFRLSLTGGYGGFPIRNGGAYNLGAIVSNRFLNNKLGLVLSASHNSRDYGSDNVEFEWTSPEVIKEHDIRKYDVKRIRSNVSANLDFRISPENTLFFKSLYSHRDDLENRFRIRYKFDSKKKQYKITRQTKGGIDNSANQNKRLERQKMWKFSLGGKHLLFNLAKVNWKIHTSKASEERPNERYITFETKKPESQIKQTNLHTRKPFLEHSIFDLKDYELKEISEENKNTYEENLGAKVDITIPIKLTGAYKNVIKFGGRYKNQTKLRDNIFHEYTKDFESEYGTMDKVKTSDQTDANYLAGNIYKAGIFTTKEFLGKLKFQPTKDKLVLDEYVPINYESTEKIYAAYGMLKQKLGEKLSGIVGLRVERTSVNYTGNKLESPEEGKKVISKTNGTKAYFNFMPNLQIKYQMIENLNLRLAYTSTIARPNYYDLVPYVNAVEEDKEVAFGNPNLKPAVSMNIDFMSEYYFSNVGIVQGGFFYKNISDFIYKYTTNEDFAFRNNPAEKYDVTKIYNGGTAQIYGFEISFERQLNFLPSFLRNLNLMGNYTYTASSTKGIKAREDGLALVGAVKNMYNVSLSYNTKKLVLRTSLNYAGDYIDKYGKDAFQDRFYDKQMFLDFNGSFAIIKQLRLFVEMKNITNQPLRFYQGNETNTMQVEYYNFNWNAGLRYNF